MKFFDSRFDLPVSASIRSANFLLDVVICVFVPVSSSPRLLVPPKLTFAVTEAVNHLPSWFRISALFQRVT